MGEQRLMWRKALLTLALLIVPSSGFAQTTGPVLILETKIPLGAISGRIDHLAIDLKRQRLFVAELEHFHNESP